MGAGTEEGKTNLGYGYTILIEVGAYFSKKILSNIYHDQTDRFQQTLSNINLFILKMCMSSLVLLVDLEISNAILF